MKIKKVFERTARLTFEQHGVTDDKRCISLYDFKDDSEIRAFVESLYGDLMKKRTGAKKCKLKVQVLDFPTNRNVKQKKLEWSYWLYDCGVNVIDWIVDKL